MDVFILEATDRNNTRNNNHSLSTSSCFTFFAISAASPFEGITALVVPAPVRIFRLVQSHTVVFLREFLSHTALIISCAAQGEGRALLTDPFKGNTVERQMKVGQEKRAKLKRAAAASAFARRRLAPLRLPPPSISARRQSGRHFPKQPRVTVKTPTEDGAT